MKSETNEPLVTNAYVADNERPARDVCWTVVYILLALICVVMAFYAGMARLLPHLYILYTKLN